MNSNFRNNIIKRFVVIIAGLSAFSLGAKAKGHEKSVRYVGIYSVPVAPELKEFAQYLSRGEFETDSKTGLETLQIVLPAELIGSETKIDLFYISELVGGKTYWKNGPNEATCEDSVISLRCEFSFEKIEIDTEKVISQLKSKNRGEFEISQRVMVSAFFGAEPIGVFEYLKSTKY